MITPWIGGVALALVPVLHRVMLGRQLAVSGRFASMVDRITEPRREAEPEMSEAELAAAFAAATEAAFGAEAVGAAPPSAPAIESSAALPLAPTRPLSHVAFFVGLALGGLVVAAASGGLSFSATLRGEAFSSELGQGPASWLALGIGGVLVGFGTRMAGGCTSGHGLCGVSRREPGSLAATAAFFGTGIGIALILERLA